MVRVKTSGPHCMSMEHFICIKEAERLGAGCLAFSFSQLLESNWLVMLAGGTTTQKLLVGNDWRRNDLNHKRIALGERSAPVVALGSAL